MAAKSRTLATGWHLDARIKHNVMSKCSPKGQIIAPKSIPKAQHDTKMHPKWADNSSKINLNSVTWRKSMRVGHTMGSGREHRAHHDVKMNPNSATWEQNHAQWPHNGMWMRE